MKLKNKKTGKIVDIANLDVTSDNFCIWLSTTKYNSLAELNEEWEDYEEPKDFWFIDADGDTRETSHLSTTDKSSLRNFDNYFDTREEAEKAAEKLKAWKRLKDKGFKFIEGYLDNNNDFIIKAKLGHVGLIDQPDVHLLFGSEE